MKLSYVFAIVLATIFGIIWCVQIWSAAQWGTELKSAGEGQFFEAREQNKMAIGAWREEVFNESSEPVNDRFGSNRIDPSTPSLEHRLEKRVHGFVQAIKSIGHRQHLAPPGVYFTLTYLSLRSPSGITGVSAGTQVVCIKDQGAVIRVRAGNIEFDAKRQYLTNDLEIANFATRDDAESQQAIAAYIAKQQQAINH